MPKHTHVNTHVHSHMQACVHAHAHAHTSMHGCGPTPSHARTHAHVCAHMSTHAAMLMQLCSCAPMTHEHTDTQTQAHTPACRHTLTCATCTWRLLLPRQHSRDPQLPSAHAPGLSRAQRDLTRPFPGQNSKWVAKGSAQGQGWGRGRGLPGALWGGGGTHLPDPSLLSLSAVGTRMPQPVPAHRGRASPGGPRGHPAPQHRPQARAGAWRTGPPGPRRSAHPRFRTWSTCHRINIYWIFPAWPQPVSAISVRMCECV